MTRTILLSALMTALLVTAGAIGYSVNDNASDSECEAGFETSKATQYKGTANGPTGAATVILNVNKGKVSGNVKGKLDGAPWNVGISGTVTKKAIAGTGANPAKNTNLVLSGDLCGKSLIGSLSGKTLDKKAWFLVKIDKQ